MTDCKDCNCTDCKIIVFKSPKGWKKDSIRRSCVLHGDHDNYTVNVNSNWKLMEVIGAMLDKSEDIITRRKQR
jgi:hypothetical protein